MRVRKDVCRAIVLTSVLWFLVDIILLFYYLDGSLTSSAERCGYSDVISEMFCFRADTDHNPRFARHQNEPSQLSPEPKRPKPLSKADRELDKLLGTVNFDNNGPGQLGAGVNVDKAHEKEMQRMFKENQFNVMASNMISINRTLPDHRSSK